MIKYGRNAPWDNLRCCTDSGGQCPEQCHVLCTLYIDHHNISANNPRWFAWWSCWIFYSVLPNDEYSRTKFHLTLATLLKSLQLYHSSNVKQGQIDTRERCERQVECTLGNKVTRFHGVAKGASRLPTLRLTTATHSSRCLVAFHCSSAVNDWWSIATWANGRHFVAMGASRSPTAHWALSEFLYLISIFH